MHDLLRLYAQRLSDDHAEADGREQARDRLLGYYLSMARAADAHLRALPGMAVPAEFTGRDGALAWLDAERASLVAAVTMAADTGRDQACLHLPLALAEYLAWRRRFDDWLAVTSYQPGCRPAPRRPARRGRRAEQPRQRPMRGAAVRGGITACQDAAAIFRETGDRHGEGRR